MMATVPHVISGLGLGKFQADGFLLTRVYQNQSKQDMKIRLPFYGTNNCEPTELFVTINWTHNP